ncbi:MAG: hypothetical protein HYY06_08325 [Deltaproteobacteria bacterium]|nr:hypothetical protein [Deltaproteobacteria bacterium]
MLKSQDVFVLLKLVARGNRSWTYPALAAELGMSASEVHAAIKRATEAGLFLSAKRTVNRSALLEFLVHGMKYAFPAARTSLTRGMPTSHAAAPLKAHFRGSLDLPPVWPDPEGEVRGEGVEPLYRSVPYAARADARLYEWLALVDAVRLGRAREREIAVRELRSRLG